jgi:drug/metabolite transporter (DMT)-like permease
LIVETGRSDVARFVMENRVDKILARQRWLIGLSMMTLYFIWGSTFLAMKFAMDSFPPFMMAALRFLCAGGLLYTLLRLRGAPDPSASEWRGAAAVGTLLVVVGNAGVAYAEQWVATGAAALAIGTVPIWAVLFAGFWGDKPHRREWLGIALGLVGVLILNLGGNMRGSPLGAVVLLLAAAGLMASAAQMLSAGAVLIAVSTISGEHMSAAPTAKSLWSMAYLIVFGSFIAYSAYLYLLKTVRPALATSYAFVNPLVAMLLGMWLAGEHVGSHELLALLAILGGVVLVLFAKAR